MPVVGNKRILTPICMNDCIKIIEMHPKSINLILFSVSDLFFSKLEMQIIGKPK